MSDNSGTSEAGKHASEVDRAEQQTRMAVPPPGRDRIVIKSGIGNRPTHGLWATLAKTLRRRP